MLGDSQEDSDEKKIEDLERFFLSTDFEQHQARIAEAFKAKAAPARNERGAA